MKINIINKTVTKDIFGQDRGGGGDNVQFCVTSLINGPIGGIKYVQKKF